MRELARRQWTHGHEVLQRAELDLLCSQLTGTGGALMVAGQFGELQKASDLSARMSLDLSYWLWTHTSCSPSMRPVVPTKKFGQNVRRHREDAGLTQEQLARSAGIHASEVSRLEREARDPRLSTIVRLAKALGVQPARLLDGIH